MNVTNFAIDPEYLAKYTVVVYMPEGVLLDCRVCQESLTLMSVELRRCLNCQCFLALPGEDITDIVIHRRKLFRPIYELVSEHCKKQIRFWYLAEVEPR